MRGMERDEIVALLGRRNAAWSTRDARALAATHAPDGTVTSPAGGLLKGRAEIERVYWIWLTAFPDIVWHPEDIVIEGDRVVLVARMVGTHSGEFFGLAPTGRRMEVVIAMVITVADGLILSERRIYDFTGLLVQTGVIKAKPSA
jgi:uncharacterized protein (TIGR02246 family)